MIKQKALSIVKHSNQYKLSITYGARNVNKNNVAITINLCKNKKTLLQQILLK